MEGLGEKVLGAEPGCFRRIALRQRVQELTGHRGSRVPSYG